jgi:hypothetical protein
MWHLKQHNCTHQLPYSNKALKKRKDVYDRSKHE